MSDKKSKVKPDELWMIVNIHKDNSKAGGIETLTWSARPDKKTAWGVVCHIVKAPQKILKQAGFRAVKINIADKNLMIVK